MFLSSGLKWFSDALPTTIAQRLALVNPPREIVFGGLSLPMKITLVLKDCGTGAGGFKPGNTCGAGGGNGTPSTTPRASQAEARSDPSRQISFKEELASLETPTEWEDWTKRQTRSFDRSEKEIMGTSEKWYDLFEARDAAGLRTLAEKFTPLVTEAEALHRGLREAGIAAYGIERHFRLEAADVIGKRLASMKTTLGELTDMVRDIEEDQDGGGR